MVPQLAPHQERLLLLLQIPLRLPGCHLALQLPNPDEEEETPRLRHHKVEVLAVPASHQPRALQLLLHRLERQHQNQRLGQLLLPWQASFLRLALPQRLA